MNSHIKEKRVSVEEETARCPVCYDDVEVDYDLVAQWNEETRMTMLSVEPSAWMSEHECEPSDG